MRIYNSSASSEAFLAIFGYRFASWLWDCSSVLPRAAMAMAVSLVQLAKRALVTLILALAQQYGVQTSAAREDVVAKWSNVHASRQTDKGGHVADAQGLQVAVKRRNRFRASAE